MKKNTAMSRAELAVKVHQRCSELPRGAVLRSIIRLQATIKNALLADQRIEIRGFGTFFLSHRKGRECRNPRTGENIYVSSRAVPRFKAGKQLRAAIDGGTKRKTERS